MNTDKENYVYFGLSGEFDPEVVAAEIGIRPTQSAAKHSIHPGRRQPRSSFLRYAQINADADLKVVDFYNLTERVVDELEPIASDLAAAVKKHGAYPTFQLVLTFPVSPDRSTPILGFSQRAIRFISTTGAEIDIDTYRGRSTGGEVAAGEA